MCKHASLVSSDAIRKIRSTRVISLQMFSIYIYSIFNIQVGGLDPAGFRITAGKHKVSIIGSSQICNGCVLLNIHDTR